ncbi:Trk K+ transport system NAD-binding subunit [Desulfobotulus alkaliphilus]|uniref:Trk K+ transport system NAD-binding subunit n=1 Tax=Desulfobotulus alkaliphilus TaxID=622671 RepID=A0A562RBJ2_9BACT|nr:NAD-binding protein [Desulfobotulus alkaliphilus]TWI65800.1 Trk K+ transport system NAD-binding subunit [Desulfobotulus alkaliphilus]
MKFLPSQLMYLLQDRRARRNIRLLSRFVFILLGVIALYSVLFHFFMQMEGQDHSWATGVYWTLTVMSTLGFGDIIFHGDIGRIFSIVVLISGIVFLLVMLPFTFIQFFYAPWLEAQTQSRAMQKLPDEIEDHVIIVGFEPVATSFIERLVKYGRAYVLLLSDVNQALALRDQGYKALAGDPDDPETYRRLKIDKACMVLALTDDMKNTNVAFTVRELSKTIPIVVNAENDASVDILRLAGATQVFQFRKMLGGFLARRILGPGLQSAVIGRFEKLVIVEAPAMRTHLVGKTILDCGIRQETGLNVVGLWERGVFNMPSPGSLIQSETVLVLVGSMEQVMAYEDFVGKQPASPDAVLILGGGRVGQAAAATLEARGIQYSIVEKNTKVAGRKKNVVIGNAADLEVLEEAGIRKAPSVFITTHSDDVNIYLTLYCRKLRPDIQIISRATLDRNIGILHTAGADLVMSYAALASNTLFNLLSPGKVQMLTEGLNIFRVCSQKKLWGKSLIQSEIRKDTGCSVIAMVQGDLMDINPDPMKIIERGTELILMGTAEAESLFMRRYPEK